MFALGYSRSFEEVGGTTTFPSQNPPRPPQLTPTIPTEYTSFDIIQVLLLRLCAFWLQFALRACMQIPDSLVQQSRAALPGCDSANADSICFLKNHLQYN